MQRSRWFLFRGQHSVAQTQKITILTRQDEYQESHQRRVTNVKDSTRQAPEANPCRPEAKCVEEDITPCHSSTKESPPLPAVVLGAEQKVYKKDSGTSGGDDHETITDEEEAEHVVDFAGP
jgi:hypothetical protein